MVPRRVFQARAANDEQTRGRIEAQEEVQPFERLLIAPLQVIDQQQQWLRHGEYGLRERLEEPLPLAILADRLGMWQVGILGGYFWENPRDFCEPQPFQARERTAQAIAPQPFGHRRERKLTLGGVAACFRGGGAPLLHPEQQLLGQPRFAHARFASYQGYARLAFRCAAPGVTQQLPLAAAPDQGWGGRGRRGHAL